MDIAADRRLRDDVAGIHAPTYVPRVISRVFAYECLRVNVVSVRVRVLYNNIASCLVSVSRVLFESKYRHSRKKVPVRPTVSWTVIDARIRVTGGIAVGSWMVG